MFAGGLGMGSGGIGGWGGGGGGGDGGLIYGGDVGGVFLVVFRIIMGIWRCYNLSGW